MTSRWGLGDGRGNQPHAEQRLPKLPSSLWTEKKVRQTLWSILVAVLRKLLTETQMRLRDFVAAHPEWPITKECVARAAPRKRDAARRPHLSDSASG